MAGAAKDFPKSKLPKTLGAAADRLFKIREDLKPKAQAKVDQLESERKAIEAMIIAKLPKSDATGVSGKAGRVRVNTKTVPQVQDWDKFRAFMKRNNRLDLVQKRIAVSSVSEILEDKKKIPGVGTFDAVTVSLTKA